ncbi:hypothetical protein KR093_011362 [Drosophila rubida]|uniref:BEN domain-containing protein n=1 Tax=Drosophila rubida TaxID=30044 RepID=A0AAD4K6J3_9MUSC|nr:hypothetical protein KR093_011362 [Drosophila rubida]
MNKTTQTPRGFYKDSSDKFMRSFRAKLDQLEGQLLQLKLKRRANNAKPGGKGKIIIGPNGTRMPKKLYEGINWTCYKKATRDLCKGVFGIKMLATHTLCGRPGRGAVIHNRKTKQKLPPTQVQDIEHCVQSQFKVDQLAIRGVIRQVCADAGRTLKIAGEEPKV